jgi:hypothetical protein
MVGLLSKRKWQSGIHCQRWQSKAHPFPSLTISMSRWPERSALTLGIGEQRANVDRISRPGLAGGDVSRWTHSSIRSEIAVRPGCNCPYPSLTEVERRSGPGCRC